MNGSKKIRNSFLLRSLSSVRFGADIDEIS